ncbi:MAG: hemerythrin domain-containing protein [Coleofasciculus sp. G1-WW12-02]|uniref:hemerythrin domain-containing protein n=1 Tax=unclassified Coleofasciculus TaxID=2692782 RepID=UPI00330125D9
MVATLTDAKRSAIAEKLADMRAIQNLIIANEQQFIKECKNNEIFGRLEDMLEDDQNNLDVLETSITQYGIQSEPKEKVQKMIEQAQEMMKSSELSLYEKLAQHELLKHGQVMSGLVVHKAAQIAGADVEEALSPLNSVNFENRAHQERLKGMLEYLGTQELTGEEPDQGLWGRVQDAVAAMTGVIGSAVTQASDRSDMDIMDIIFMDHQKAKTLISEIKGTNNPQRIQEFFGQLYKDVIVHAKAEEEIVYPQVRSFYGEDDTQELYDEQAELETILNEMKELDPTSSEFKSKLKQVKDMIGDHTRQEESTMFASIRKNLSPEQREQMATQFKEVKKKLQSQM